MGYSIIFLFFLLCLAPLGMNNLAHAIALPDSVSQAELGLAAAREFSETGPIPTRHCASLREELFPNGNHHADTHGGFEIIIPKKKNPFRNIFLRMQNFKINRFDCRAYVNEAPELCQTDDCRAILSQESTLCQSPDCRAVLQNDSAQCSSVECRAFLQHDSSLCQGNCPAYVRNDANFCEDDDCKAHIERRSINCKTNICHALVQKETFFCFKEDEH